MKWNDVFGDQLFVNWQGRLKYFDLGKTLTSYNQEDWYFLYGEKYLTLPSNPYPSNPNQQHYITKKEFITNLTWPNQPPQSRFLCKDHGK